jgi:hypothetical protein
MWYRKQEISHEGEVIESDTGGGASRSTDPAAGSSAATDVSLREHLESQLRSLDRFYQAEVTALKELIETKHDAAQEAVKLALASQKELAEKHNDLIRQGERKDETYATRAEIGRLENWQNKITGGLILLSLVGIANLVKLWVR